jgi:hypothetical protein
MLHENAKPLTDIAAHNYAMSAPIEQVVKDLVDLLGATTVADIAGVGETRAVARWMAGRQPQRAHTLRFALQIASMIAAAADTEIARAWFQGSNPHLDDAVPAQVLRDEPLEAVQPKLMAAAREFAARD